MKKALVLLVVAALTLFSSVALAGEIAVSGSIDTRSWNVNNRDFSDLTGDRQRKTETRVRLNIDGKLSDTAKARISIENDWDTWGRLEDKMANGNPLNTSSNTGYLDLREAWVQVGLPLGLNLKGGHQLLQLGNGWFFRSMKWGSDAWVLFKDIDNLHLGFVDVKVSEGFAAVNPVVQADDWDAYVLVGTYKVSDDMKIGVDISDVKKRQSGVVAGVNPDEMINIGVNFDGKLGPVALKAEFDTQMGDNGASGAAKSDYEGMSIVAQGSMAFGPVSARAMFGMGTGPEAGAETEEFVTYLDNDPHYGAIYEYLVGQPYGGAYPGAHEGVSNTTVLGVGATYKVSDNLSVSGDLLKLAANETPAGADDDLGMEVAVRIGWQIEKGVNWNWTIAQFMVGDAYGANADDVEAIYGVLGVAF